MFRVEWLQAALDQLAAAWVLADSELRLAITRSVHLVDKHLRQDPLRMGESRGPGERIYFVAPLAVTFRVNKGNRVVTVLSVRTFRRLR